ncbi:MAG: NTP transferase domain-containing protein [Actinomycetota bacterium]
MLEGVRAGSPGPALAAVVLAGGRAARLGGADKPALVVGGQPLLASVVQAAVGAGASQVIIVGPPRPGLDAGAAASPASLTWVREDPPGSGPVAALRCGLAGVTAPLTLLLAADLPFLRARQLTALLQATGEPAPGEGAVLVDDAGWPQWLVGCWVTAALRTGLASYQGRSLHGLLEPLRPARLSWVPAAGEPPPWLDCDTSGDLRRAQSWSRP